jgi:hypothetical protein
MERILRTIRLFASVTNANLGKIKTAPIVMISTSAGATSVIKLTNSEPVSTERQGFGILVVESVDPCAEVHAVYEHKHDVEPVDKTAAEDCESQR